MESVTKSAAMISRYRNYVLLNNENPLETGHDTNAWLSRKGNCFVLAALLLSLVLNSFLLVQRLYNLEECTHTEHSAYGTYRLWLKHSISVG